MADDPFDAFPDAAPRGQALDPFGAFPDAAPPTGRTWGQVPGQALGNVGKSAVEFGKSVVQPIMHPVETAKAFRDIGAGLVSKAKGLFGDDADPAAKAQREAAVDAIGAHLAERYGSIEGLKKTIAEDPVGFLADASLVLTGGGAVAARAPGVVGKAGQVASKVGNAADPLLMPFRAANIAGQGAGKFASAGLGLTTGMGGDMVRKGFDAGRIGGTASDVYTGQARGTRPMDEVVDMAGRGVEGMGRDRRAAYNANMANTRANTAPIDVAPVRAALDAAAQKLQHNGFVKDATAAGVHAEMAEKFNEFLQIPRAQRSAEAFDALKQSIGEIRDRTVQGKLSRGVVDDVYKAISAEIVKQSPDYAKAMSEYAGASDLIGEARRTLSINDKASTDTTLRKLQSTTRNNANANFGARQKLVDELAKYEPDLPYALAGQAANAKTARGIAGPLSGMYGLANVANPAMWPNVLAQLALTSPRLVGEGAHLAGQGARVVDNIAGATVSPLLAAGASVGVTPQRASQAALLSYLLGEAAPDGGWENALGRSRR